MQAFLNLPPYVVGMATKSNLRRLREAAGISLRELARQIGESHSNVSYWERSGQTPPGDTLLSIAKALGVTVDELLGGLKPRRSPAPGGRLGQIFDAVSKLPRRQQQKVMEMAEGFIALHKNDSGQSKAA
jgi:transcriptional regulator with XRE-family HTH domain